MSRVRVNAAGAVLLFALTAIPVARGSETLSPERLDWMLNCQGCHLADGSGSPGLVPPVKNFASRFLDVGGGREFLVQVPGVATSPLTDKAIARLMNWMLREFDPDHLPHDFRPYTEAEIARLRKNPLREDLTLLREQLVAEIALRASE